MQYDFPPSLATHTNTEIGAGHRIGHNASPFTKLLQFITSI